MPVKPVVDVRQQNRRRSVAAIQHRRGEGNTLTHSERISKFRGLLFARSPQIVETAGEEEGLGGRNGT